jgi:hypothetical protein
MAAIPMGTRIQPGHRSFLLIAVRAQNSTIRALLLYFSRTPALPFPMVARLPAQISKLLPFRKLLRCTEAQKCLFVSPFPATPMQTRGMGVPPLLQLPRQASLPPSYAPRGASILCGLSRLRILPVATGVHPPSFPTADFQTFKRANSFACKGLPPLCRLFALFSALAAFVFNRLQPLSTKHPGYGVRFSLPRSPLATRPGEDCG